MECEQYWKREFVKIVLQIILQNCLFIFSCSQKVIALLVGSVTTKLDIDGSDFKEKYNFLQFHFHWGRNNYQGSEHQINDKKYPLEVWRFFFS